MAEKGYQITRGSGEALARLIRKDKMQGGGVSAASGPLHATRVVPHELTSDWSTNDDGEYVATAQRVVMDSNTGLYTKDTSAVVVDLYSPCTTRNADHEPIQPPSSSSGSRVQAVYRGRWEVGPTQSGLRWAVAYEDWNEGAASLGEGYPRVECQPCDSSGENVDTTINFDIWLPRKRIDVPGTPKYDRDGDPAVFEDDVIGYVVDAEGNAVCATHYMDRRIGAIEIWNGYEDRIKRGWRLCDGVDGATDLTARFLMGVDPGGSALASEDDIGDTGGHRWHGSTENNHTTHDGEASTLLVQSQDPGGVTVIDGDLWHDGTYNTDASPENGDTDNRPRYFVVAFIERFE